MKRSGLQPLMGWFILLTAILALLNVPLKYLLGFILVSFVLSAALYIRKNHVFLLITALLIYCIGIIVSSLAKTSPVVKLGAVLVVTGFLLMITLSIALGLIFKRSLSNPQNPR